jgi:HEAT repeats
MWRRSLLVPLLIAILASPGQAGLLRKTPKPDPVQRVPQLLKALKEEPDERKRADAVEELRDYDLKAFPEIMPAVIDALQNDPGSSVRAEAANTISKLRPISQQAGFALEQTLQSDSSLRVRMAARTTLWHYYLLGYRSTKPTDKVQEETEEPPLADPPMKSAPQPPKAMPAVPKAPTSRSWFSFLRRDSSASKQPAPEAVKVPAAGPMLSGDNAAKPPLLLLPKAPSPYGSPSAAPPPPGRPEAEGPVLDRPK